MDATRRVFLKQLGMGTIGASVVLQFPHSMEANADKKLSLPRSKPELQGISSKGISSFLQAIEQSNIEFHSIMILRHGHVVAEGWWSPYAPKLKHTLYSLSKSFTSTAVGLAISEGRFALDSPVTSFFPNELPAEVSPNLAAMKVKHLLTMSTGHTKDTIPVLRATTDNWVKTFLAQPVDLPPGTHFLYNTGATYILSAIVQKVTGKPLIQYLRPRLFDPLGIEGMDWETDPQGIINTGGYGLRVRTEDIAKLGQLYLQKGTWKGVEILPASWVADATTSHIDNSPPEPKIPKEQNDWSQGYGYQFWRCTHSEFRGDGAFGQFCIVMPDKDTVVAITSESFDLQASMNLVWNHLYPAISDGKLPADDQASQQLLEKISHLSLNPTSISNDSPLIGKISGKLIALDENEFSARSVSFRFSAADCLFTLIDEKGEHRIRCGIGKWLTEEQFKTQILFPMKGRPQVDTPLAASATWTDPHTLTITLRYTATAHSDNLICGFEDNKMTIRFLNSVSKGNPDSAEKRADLHGRFA